MKQISGFAAISINNGIRISYTYDEINSSTGELISQNNKKSFYVVDSGLKNNIDSIFDFIKSKEEA